MGVQRSYVAVLQAFLVGLSDVCRHHTVARGLWRVVDERPLYSAPGQDQ